MTDPAISNDVSARRPVRIGLTGPIGCGKSTVAARLATHGAIVIDADRLARDVTGPGEPAVAAIAERFGQELVDADGRLDRAALGRIVFADPTALADLEAIVHPAVRPRILAALGGRRRRRASAPAVVLEAIRLVDGGYVDLGGRGLAGRLSARRPTARGSSPGAATRTTRTDGSLAQAGLVASAPAGRQRRDHRDGRDP